VRGEKTRALLLDTALPLFERHGFHGTSIDEIARAAGVSRATLYQYFGSKEAVFAELLEECGAALVRVVRRLGPLGPGVSGFDNLHWWIGEWAWVYDRYATLFVEWSRVDSPGSEFRSMVSRFVTSFDERIAHRLENSEMDGIDPPDAALVLMSVVHRVNYLRHRGITLGRPASVLLDNLAVVMQLFLFPDTTGDVFRAVLPSRRRESDAPGRWPPPQQGAAVADACRTRIAELRPRPAATVRRMLDAGAHLLAASGYHATSVDDIVAAAGLTRGTFYRYFDEKLDLLVVLSEECAAASAELAARFAELAEPAERDVRLRGWLADFVDCHDRYLGVYRAWVDAAPEHPVIAQCRRAAAEDLRRSFVRVLRGVERAYPLDVGAGAIVLIAILERLPEALREQHPRMAKGQLIDLMARTVQRALL
jgi:AcrR family transcriptional regulator